MRHRTAAAAAKRIHTRVGVSSSIKYNFIKTKNVLRHARLRFSPLLSSYRQHSSTAIAQGNDRRWWEGGGQQLMVKAKTIFLNRDEKIEATHRRDRERESLLLLLHHQLVISDGGSREAQSVKNRPRAATAAAVKAKGREAHPAGGLSAIPRSRNTREKKNEKKKKEEEQEDSSRFFTWQHLKRCSYRQTASCKSNGTERRIQ